LLACPNCKAGLALAARAPQVLSSVLAAFWLFFFIARPNLFLEGMILGGFLVAVLAVGLFSLWELRHPELKIRNRPKPEISLNLNLPGPRKIN
jgi:hypothetical protein